MATCFDKRDDRAEKIQYDSSEYPIYIRRELLSAYPNYSAFSHWHDAVEFIVILSGSMYYNINGTVIHLTVGEGVFVNARQLHFGYSEQVECDFLCILLHPLLLCTLPAMEQEYIMPLLQNQNAAYLKLQPENQVHQRIMDALLAIYEKKDMPAAPLRTQAAFAAIWADLFELIPIPNRKKGSTMGSNNLTILKSMLSFIQHNYTGKISLAGIAASGAVGQSKCYQLFHAYLHQTPNEYLTAYRLRKSSRLLCETDLTVSEIALEVGFGGASYYAETFRKWFGQSPMEYKASYRLQAGRKQ